MAPQNPDFSLAAKHQIARATRLVLRKAANNADVARPAVHRGGSGGIPRPEVPGQLLVAVANGEFGWSEAPLVELP